MFHDKSNGLKQKSRDKNGRYFCPPLSSARLNLAQRDWWENHTGDYRCHAHARVWQTSFRECVTVSSEAAAKGVKIQVLKKKTYRSYWELSLAAETEEMIQRSQSAVLMATSSTCVVYVIFGWKCDGKVECVFFQQLEKKNLVYSAWNLSTILHTCLVVKYHNN